MQEAKTRTFHAAGEPDPAVTEAAFSHATVYPKNAQLPDDFRNADFSKTALCGLTCLHDGTPCDIYILPYGAPGDSAIIVRVYNKNAASRPLYLPGSGQVFQRDRESKWVNTGYFPGMGCAGIVDALRDGEFMPVRPEYDDLLVNGIRLRFSPVPRRDDACVRELARRPGNIEDKTRDADAPTHMGPAFGKP
jgi:hypothetical protein